MDFIRRKKNILLIFNVLILLVIFFLDKRSILVETSLELDEILSWNLALNSWGDLFKEVYGFTHQILYYLILKIWIFFSPVNNDYWIRVPSLLFSFSSLALIFSYFFERGKEVAGVFVVLLFYFNSEFLFLSTHNRPYALLLFLAVINILSLSIYLKGKNKIFSDVFFISLLLMLLTHYISVFYVVAMVIALSFLKIPILKKRKWTKKNIASPIRGRYRARVPKIEYLFLLNT